MLHVIPLTIVESRKEVDDVKELLSICKEYHIALRCELRRKELKVRPVSPMELLKQSSFLQRRQQRLTFPAPCLCVG